MLPKNVLHKRNGHRQPPPRGPRSAGEILGLVHRDSDRASELSPELARFSAIVQSERLDPQWEHMVAMGMTLPSALARALTRTREAFERGEFAELRAALDGLRAQAAAAADMIARLTSLAQGSPAAAPADGGRHILSLNDLVLRALDRLSEGHVVTSRLDPGVPHVAGHPGQLEDILVILVDAVARGRGTSPGSPITVETTHHDGVLAGESVVRVVVTDEDAPALDRLRPMAFALPPGNPNARVADALGRAAQLAREHGGMLSTAARPAGGVCFVLDLPAL